MSTLPRQPNREEIEAAARVLRSGNLVAFPTETVYGLGANALEPVAVAQIFARKQRPRFDPLIVHVAHPDDIDRWVRSVPDAARELVARFWPGPLTIVLPKSPQIPNIVTADLETVAIRCPAHPVARDLIAEAGVPIAAPSANLFGKVSPTTADHVRASLGEEDLVILDAGACQVGVESTVVAFDEQGVHVLRPGGVTREEIEQVTAIVAGEDAASHATMPTAPGMLASHYAPTIPLQLVETLPQPPADEDWGAIALRTVPGCTTYAAVEILSERGDLNEAAANLFAAMRRLEALPLDRIIAVELPEVGLGMAMMDRLRRAAQKGRPV